MKFVIFVLLLTIIAAALAEESVGYFKNPAFPGKCVYGGMILSPGEEGKPFGKCEMFMCQRDDGFGKIIGCGATGVKANCQLGNYINPYAPFDECCKRRMVCS